MSSSFVLLALYFAYRLKAHVAYTDAAWCGVCLFLAFIAKTNAIPYFSIPVFAALLLWTHQRKVGQHTRWLGVALGVGLGLAALFIIGLRLRGYDYFFSSFAFAVGGRYSTTTSELARLINIPQIVEHVRVRVEMIAAYFGWLYVAAAVASVFICLWKRYFFLLAVLLIPSAVLVVSGVQETRYWFAPMAILMVTIAAGCVTLAQQRLQSRLVLSFIVCWGLLVAFPFWITATQNPLAMPLYTLDKREYIYSDAAGSGLDETIAVLESHQPMRVLGALANCQGLRYRAWQRLAIECLPISPSGEDAAAIAATANAINAPHTYLVLETSPYAPASVEGQIIAVIQRPTALASLTIYQLSK